jgi:thioredoxin-related protein
MNKQYLILASLSLYLLSSLTFAERPPNDLLDWTQTSDAARASQIPILVLYTAPACPYCERLKQEVLTPMFREGSQQPLAVVRELDINTAGKMVDFDGLRIRSRHFKQRYQVFATPTLLILDADGLPLSDPIVGYDSKQAYKARLDRLLQRLQNVPKPWDTSG